MAKSLKDILQGVKSSKKVTNDLGGYKPKAGDEEEFAKKHEIEKHEDRVGNDDDVYNATNVKHAMEKETRHGYKKPKDAAVNESKMRCEACGKMYEGDSCGCGEKKSKEAKPGKKGMLYGDKKVSVTEAWYSEKGGERTFHKGQREAMRHAREIGGKYGATHGAQGMKASKALGWDAKEKEGLGIGLTSKADKVKAAQKQKAAKKVGPWGLREASLPAVVKSNLPVPKSNLPAVIKNKPVAKTGAEAKPGMSDRMKKTIGTGAVLGTAAAGYASLPDDDDDEDTKRPSEVTPAGKKDDFPAAGKWFDLDNKKDASEVIPTQSIPVDTPKKEPEKKEPEEKKPESWWDKQSRMKGEIEDAKHEMRLKRIRAGEKDEDDAPKAKAADDSSSTSGKKIADPVTMKVTTKKDDDDAKLPDPMMDVVKRAAKMNKAWNDSKRSVNEVFAKKTPAGEMISDFIHSKDPQFAGKSKEKRKEMALGAYYKMHPEKSKKTNEEAEIEEALKGKQHKIDKNKNGKIDAEDFKLLRKEETVSEEDTGGEGTHNYHVKKIKEIGDEINKKVDAGQRITLSDPLSLRLKKHKAALKKIQNEEANLEEAVKTGNEGHGYHGEAYGAAKGDDKMAEAGKAYAKAHALVKQHAAEHLKDVKNPNKTVKHYLDSQYGRHLHGNENDAGYVKKDFAHFKKKYKPEMHESLAVPLLGEKDPYIGKTKLKKKVKEQSPETPLTLPNMSVDVNTGRNV